MRVKVASPEYRALSELRYQIRQFLSAGDAAAREAGLEPQQYLLLLAIRGMPQGTHATIGMLAERLALKHNSAVELINRLEARGLAHRNRTGHDRRCVLISLLPDGARLVEQVARKRITELREEGTALVNALHALIDPKKKAKPLRKPARKSERQS